jgi:uncharacterized protein YeaO (DUF488 family)
MAARRKRRAATARDEEVPGGYSSPPCFLHELEPPPRRMPTRGIAVKRVYDPPQHGDGWRVLVDRLWPRGISKKRAALDEWLVDLAPSTALRQWFHHDPTRWREFGARYRAELRAHAAGLQVLRQRARRQRVTLLYASRDPHVNHAVVLQAVLRRPLRRRLRH